MSQIATTQQASTTRAYTCGFCRAPGHRAPDCPEASDSQTRLAAVTGSFQVLRARALEELVAERDFLRAQRDELLRLHAAYAALEAVA